MDGDDLRQIDGGDGGQASGRRGAAPPRRAMTRRRFLRSSLGLTGLMLLAACSPATQPSAPAAKGAPDSKPAAPAAKSAEKGGGGGQIVLTSQSEPLTLNPAFTPV